MLKVFVNSIKEDPVDFTVSVKSTEVELDSEIRILDDIQGIFQIQRMGEKVMIRGELSTRISLLCSRCAADFFLPLRASVFLLAVPETESAGAQLEAETEMGDPAILQYAGEQIDLLPEIQSALILALPMKPLCRPDCPGLCPACGQMLSEKHVCPPADQPGPFSVLKQWQGVKKNEEE